MRHLNALPRLLLSLPAALQICIATLCTAGILLFFILLAPMAQNAAILAIPLTVVAWIYRKRGTVICLLIINVVIWMLYVARTHNMFLTRALRIDFVIGDIALLFIGILISSQRDWFERTKESQHQFAKAYEEEQRLHQAKDRFIQHVNHELRTPLTALSGYLELLIVQNEQFDAEMRASFLQNAMLSCEELQLLVGNILESLQVSNGQTEVILKEVCLANIVHQVIQQTDPRWELEPRVQLEIPAGTLVLAHSQYLRQVLRNLLSNAVKYAPGSQPILVSARQVHAPGSKKPEISICVKDSGPGIPPDEIQQIFDQFIRLERDTLGQIRGSGLGLSISKQLVEAMGGRIWVESSGVPGEGSSFTFTLPQG
ncbi:MAG TPA: HAMP domain-containing sensor histidine kinase [Ktedonobacteraceae bacterium]|nr:HAMP domain-containing sensor histidine kinase [Ktedonobacteraceae bacterium]